MKFLLLIFMIFLQFGYANEPYYYQNNQKITLTPDHSISDHHPHIDYYQNSKGIVLGVTDKIIIKTKDGIDIAYYLDDFNLTLIKKLDTNIYVLKTQDKNVTIETANRLDKKEDIVYAQPDFIKRRLSR